MSHLDEAMLQKVLDDPGQVPPEIWAHLDSDCAQCAAFLQQRSAVDRLDGAVDDLLTAPLHDKPGGAPSWEAFEARRRPRPTRRWAAAGALALAASLAAVVLTRPAKPHQTLKGIAGPQAEASLAFVDAAGQVHRATADGVYPAAGALSLELRLGAPAAVSVVRQGPGGAEVLLLNEPMPAGTHELSHQGQPVAVSLAGLAGAQKLVVLASPQPLPDAQVQAAARGAAPAGSTRLSFEIQVKP